MFTRGIFRSILRGGFEIEGSRRFLYIFSIIRGTDNIKFGLISEKACVIICGEGVLVRKVIWQPIEKGKRNSKANP